MRGRDDHGHGQNERDALDDADRPGIKAQIVDHEVTHVRVVDVKGREVDHEHKEHGDKFPIREKFA